MFLIGGRLFGFAFAFAIPVALSRLLDQTAFGAYKQFFLVAAFLVAVLPAGFDSSLFFFIPQDIRRAGHYLAQAIMVSLMLGGIAALMIYIWREPLAEFLNSPLLVRLAPFLAGFVLFEAVGQLIERTVVIEQQAWLAAGVFAGSDAARAAALILPAALSRSVAWVAIGASIYAVARFGAVMVWMLRHYRGRFNTGRLVVRFREQAAYALPFGAGGVVHHALLRFHALYIAAAFSPSVFAVYAVGSQQIAPVQIFFRSLFEVSLVRMSEYFGAGRHEEMRSLWRKLIARQAVLIVPLVVALWLLAGAFVEGVFTANYLDAVPVFRVHLLLIALTMLNDHSVLRACGYTSFILGATAAGLVATVMLVPILTSMAGLTGAAWGLVGGMATMKALGLMKVRKVLGLRVGALLPWYVIGKYMVASLLAAGLVYPVMHVIGDPLIRFLGCGALFWLAYGSVGWMGNCFQPDDKWLVQTVAKSVWGRLGRVLR